MKLLQKAAVFLLMIGFEKGSKVMNLMDDDEVKSILSEFSKLPELPTSIQESVQHEFEKLGYTAEMNPAETLYVLRQLFNGSKISAKENKSFF